MLWCPESQVPVEAPPLCPVTAFAVHWSCSLQYITQSWSPCIPRSHPDLEIDPHTQSLLVQLCSSGMHGESQRQEHCAHTRIPHLKKIRTWDQVYNVHCRAVPCNQEKTISVSRKYRASRHVKLCCVDAGYSILCIVLLGEHEDDRRQHLDTSADPGTLCTSHHKDSVLPLKGFCLLREAICRQ